MEAVLKRFRLVGGSHVEDLPTGPRMPKTYKTGDVVESEHDLVDKFPNKFELIEEEKETKKAKQAAPQPVEEEEEEENVSKSKRKKKGGPIALGEDVTEMFDGAPAGFVVLKDGRKYYIAKEDALDTALNKEPLTNKASVIEYLESFKG